MSYIFGKRTRHQFITKHQLLGLYIYIVHWPSSPIAYHKQETINGG